MSSLLKIKLFSGDLFAVLIIFCAAVVFMGSTLLPPAGKMLFGWDIRETSFYTHSYYRNSILHGRVPFWDPYTMSGTPLLALPNVTPFYPPAWILLILPPQYSFAYFELFHLILSGIFMYILVRKKFGKAGALFSAVVYAVSGFMAARTFGGNLEYIEEIAWPPAILYCFEQAFADLKRKKYFLLAVLTLYCEIVATMINMTVFTLVLLAIFTLFAVIKYKSFRPAITALLIVIFASGLSMVQILPNIELVQNASRGNGLTYEQVTVGSYTPDLFHFFIDPFHLGNPFAKDSGYWGPPPNYFEMTYFMGKTTVAMVFLSFVLFVWDLIRKRKVNSFLLFFFFSTVFFSFMAMGNHAPLYKIFYDYFPYFKSFRIPARMLAMVVFSVATVSGFAVSRLKFSLVKALPVALVLFELIQFKNPMVKNDIIPNSRNDQALIRYLQTHVSNERVYPKFMTWDWQSLERLHINSGSMYLLPMINGYYSMINNNYYRFIDTMSGNTGSSFEAFPTELPGIGAQTKTLDFLGVRYFIIPIPWDEIGHDIPGKYKLVYTGNGLNLYENLTALPRFFPVKKVTLFPQEKSLENSLINQSADLSETVLIPFSEVKKSEELSMPQIQSMDCPSVSPSDVSIVSYLPEKITLRTKSGCDTFLSSSEIYYPGWKAFRDGKETTVYRSNMAFRSVYLPKGEHTVEFVYQPVIYYKGAAICAGTLLIMIFAMKKIYGKKHEKNS